MTSTTADCVTGGSTCEAASYGSSATAQQRNGRPHRHSALASPEKCVSHAPTQHHARSHFTKPCDPTWQAARNFLQQWHIFSVQEKPVVIEAQVQLIPCAFPLICFGPTPNEAAGGFKGLVAPNHRTQSKPFATVGACCRRSVSLLGLLGFMKVHGRIQILNCARWQRRCPRIHAFYRLVALAQNLHPGIGRQARTRMFHTTLPQPKDEMWHRSRTSSPKANGMPGMQP